MRPIHVAPALFATFALAACAVPQPSGPSVMALPGQGKSFDAFQHDDFDCRQYASLVGGGPAAAQAGTDRAVGTAVVGTALGAGLGAAIGAASGAAGAGAAIGAASGAVLGTAAGASSAQASYAGAQQQYDVAYTQCMYSKGDSVQSAPPAAYAGGYPYGYPYGGYPAYGYAPPIAYSPTVVVGGGWGGWGGGWGRPYPYGGYGYRRYW